MSPSVALTCDAAGISHWSVAGCFSSFCRFPRHRYDIGFVLLRQPLFDLGRQEGRGPDGFWAPCWAITCQDEFSQRGIGPVSGTTRGRPLGDQTCGTSPGPASPDGILLCSPAPRSPSVWTA